MRHLLVLIISLFFFSACVKDQPQPAEAGSVMVNNSRRVLISCEGNFGSGNSALSAYDLQSEVVVEDLYKTQNANTCGDVLQSVASSGQKYYLVMNNSAKILVCDKDLKKLAEIRGLSSPRYFLPISNAKAYVSDLHDNGINIVDLNSNQRISKIPCSGWTEGMQKIYNKVFVCNVQTKYLYVINSIVDEITDSLEVGFGAGSLVLDKEDKMWVLSSGKSGSADKAQLVRFDPLDLKILQRIVLENNSAFNLRINGEKDQIYFLDEGVQTLSLNDQAVKRILDNVGHNYYGLGIEPSSGDLYLSDAHDYTQASTIYVFKSTGEKKKNFNVGINAGGFYFE